MKAKTWGFYLGLARQTPTLLRRLADLYPNFDQLNLLGLGTADHKLLWEHARDNDLVLITKDADFADLSVIHGFPPKVVWRRTGNCRLRTFFDDIILGLPIWQPN